MPTKKESQAAGLPPMINLGLSAEDTPTIKNAKQTQSQHRRLPPLCETNPIYPTPTIPPTQKTRNEPNFDLQPPGPRHKYAKRTQFPPLAIPTRREPVRKPNGISHLYILAYSRVDCYDSSEFHSSLINHGYLRWK